MGPVTTKDDMTKTTEGSIEKVERALRGLVLIWGDPFPPHTIANVALLASDLDLDAITLPEMWADHGSSRAYAAYALGELAAAINDHGESPVFLLGWLLPAVEVIVNHAVELLRETT